MNAQMLGVGAALAVMLVGRGPRGRCTPALIRRRASVRSATGRVRWWPLRKRRRMVVDWAGALDGIAAEMRTGSSLVGAMARCSALDEVTRSIAAGESPVDALRRANAGAAGPEADTDRELTVATLIAVAAVGGSAGSILDHAAGTIRERREVAAERQSQAAQARLSALVLSVLPAIFALWSMGTDQRVRSFLLGSSFGVGCLAVGATANIAGWMWMKQLIGTSR